MRLEFAGVGEGIAQDESSFGICVEDFDGGAGHGGDHIARPRCLAARHVLGGRGDGNDIERQLGFDRGEQRAQHCRRAAHVELHLVHGLGFLQADAAGVEGDAFADEDDRRRSRIASTEIIKSYQAAFACAATTDREEGAHAARLHLALVHVGALNVVGLGKALGLGEQVVWCAFIAGQVAEFARECLADIERFNEGDGVRDVLIRLNCQRFEFWLLALFLFVCAKAIELACDACGEGSCRARQVRARDFDLRRRNRGACDFAGLDGFADSDADFAHFLKGNDFTNAEGDQLLGASAFRHGDACDFACFVLGVAQGGAQVPARRDLFIEGACHRKWNCEAWRLNFGQGGVGGIELHVRRRAVERSEIVRAFDRRGR